MYSHWCRWTSLIVCCRLLDYCTWEGGTNACRVLAGNANCFVTECLTVTEQPCARTLIFAIILQKLHGDIDFANGR